MTEQLLTGKTCLITGATDGIGKVTARELSAMGATVIIHGRNPAKTEQAVRDIQQTTGSDRIDSVLADFAELAQVRTLAAQITERYDRLDVLVNNAGLIMMRRTETADGFETMFGVNHLGPFLLTNLLLDLITASAPARIVNVASSAHLRGKLDFDDLQYTQNYNARQAYANSKLANVLFTYELARRLASTDVTVNALHPGVVGTNLAMNNLPGLLRPIGRWVFHRFTISAEEGARTMIHLAASPEVEGITGKYFYQEKEHPSSPTSHDEAVQRHLWEVSAQLTGLA